MTTNLLVVGGGPAGTAAAIRLARAGAQVTLLEREHVPSHKVCGEFLSGEALFYLKQMGVDLRDAGAVPLDQIRLTSDREVIERSLPFQAMSLTRRRLDEELLRRAEQVGVRVDRGCRVEHLTNTGDTWHATLADGRQIAAGTVFLATGKHDLRGHRRPAGKQRGMIALKMYWQLNAAQALSMGNAVELLTYRGGYAGLQPVEGGLVNLCCLIHSDEFRRLGGMWNSLLTHLCLQSAHLRRRLGGAVPQLDKPLTIASLPYGFVRNCSAGLWYLGDQAAVIPSFTGDGMSLALHTGVLAAEMYLRNESADCYQRSLARQIARQVFIATLISKAIVHTPRLATLLPRLWPDVIDLTAKQTRIDPTLWLGRNAPGGICSSTG